QPDFVAAGVSGNAARAASAWTLYRHGPRSGYHRLSPAQIGERREQTNMTIASSGLFYRVAVLSALCLTAVAMALPARAQIAVSANDNKVVNVEGVNNIVQNPAPDNVTIIDLGVSPPKVLGQLDVPNSVVGP